MRGRSYPSTLQANAIALRGQGLSLLEVSQQLRVPKNTVQGWVHHVRLTKAQLRRLEDKAIESAARGRPLAKVAWQEKIERWKSRVQRQFEHLGPLPFTELAVAQLVCGILYICEGAKYPTTRGLAFSNTDPRMIKLFLLLVRRHFRIEERKFRIRIMHRWDQDGLVLQRFWSQETGIPLEQFYATYADKRTKHQPTQRVDYHGVCCVHYPSTTLQYQLQAIGESVLKMVEQEGLEPSASTMPSSRSAQLSYCPMSPVNFLP